MDYLAKGGRIGGASALLGNAFQIKPILTITDGRVEQFTKECTFSKSLHRSKSLILDQYHSKDDGHLTILHEDNSYFVNDFAA